MSVFIALITNSKRYYLIKKRMIFMIQNRSYWTILSQRKREHQRQIPPLIFFYFDWIKRKKNLLNINEGDENNLLAFLSLFPSGTLRFQSSFLLLLRRFPFFFSSRRRTMHTRQWWCCCEWRVCHIVSFSFRRWINEWTRKEE